MTSYQSAWSQSSHEDCGPSVGRLTRRPPDPSVTLRDNELAGAVAQCAVHDTAYRDEALWHTEPPSHVRRWRGQKANKVLIATCTTTNVIRTAQPLK